MAQEQPNPAPNEDRFVTIEAIQQLLAVNRTTVDAWLATGELAHYRIGPRTIRIDRADLEVFLAARRRVGDSRDEAPPSTTKRRREQSSAASNIRKTRSSAEEAPADESPERAA